MNNSLTFESLGFDANRSSIIEQQLDKALPGGLDTDNLRTIFKHEITGVEDHHKILLAAQYGLLTAEEIERIKEEIEQPPQPPQPPQRS